MPNILKSWYPKNTFNYSIMSLDSSLNALIDCCFCFFFRFCLLCVFAGWCTFELALGDSYVFIYDFIIKCVLDERAVERSTRNANSDFVTSINRNCFTIETIHELLSLVNAIRNYLKCVRFVMQFFNSINIDNDSRYWIRYFWTPTMLVSECYLAFRPTYEIQLIHSYDF